MKAKKCYAFIVIVLLAIASCSEKKPGADLLSFVKYSDSFSLHKRDGNFLLQFGDYLYSFGGWNPYLVPTTDSEVYMWHVDRLNEKPVLTYAPWPGRHTYAAGVKNDTLYVWFGDIQHGPHQMDVWGATQNLNTGALAWFLIADSVGIGDRILYGHWIDSAYLYVAGGQIDGDVDNGSYEDVWRSPNGLNWEKISDSNKFLGKNLSGTVVRFNGYVYQVSGGVYDSVQTAYKTLYRSGDNGVTWEKRKDVPFKERVYPNTIVFDNKLWMFFGGNIENLSDIWCMDTNENWIQVQNESVEPRHASGLTVVKDTKGNEKIVIAAGNFWNDFWVVELKKEKK